MSSRDIILASIRANLPKLDRPLPVVPKFEENGSGRSGRGVRQDPDAHGRALGHGSHRRHAGDRPGSS